MHFFKINRIFAEILKHKNMYTESLTLNDIETVESQSDLLAKELENSYSPKEFKQVMLKKLAEYYADLRR